MQKNMVGAKLAWKQTCQIYPRRDENMECTLDSVGISFFAITLK